MEFDWEMGYKGNNKIKICKIVVLGEQSKFKVQLINYYTNNSTNDNIKHLEINEETYNLQVWDVPNNIFNLRNQSMANIYCQHCNLAIIVIDVTNNDAINNATNIIISIKDLNKNISIIILANKWNSTQRQFNETDIDSFCKDIHSHIIWRKIELDQDEKGIDSKMISSFDKTIKQMITQGIRANYNTYS